MDCVNRPKLRGIMAEKGYNITSLAAAIGVSRDALSRFLRGYPPNYKLMKALTKGLQLTSEQAGSIFFDPDLRST